MAVRPEHLRSALRTLIALDLDVYTSFVEHIHSRLQASVPPFTVPPLLFPRADYVSGECTEYLSLTRCLFAAKLADQAIPYLTHFTTSISRAGASWTADSALETLLHGFAGDVVQAMQALKESPPESASGLRANLESLLASFDSCREYCTASWLSYPLDRAERQARDTLSHFFPEHGSGQAGAAGSPVETLDISRPTKPPREALDMALPTQPPVKTLNLALPRRKRVEFFKLGQRDVPRLFVGLWQLSSPVWGSASTAQQQDALVELFQAGFTAADMADHYGDAELVWGDFRHSLPLDYRPTIFAATKWCVFKPLKSPISPSLYLSAVQERWCRLRGKVDLLQLHWHYYEAKGYLQVLRELIALTKSHPHLLSAVGLCNFDAVHTEEVCKYQLLWDGEVGIVSNQVQFSLIDSRPLRRMTRVCVKYNIKLLTYGSLCGGFLSEQWLEKPAPEPYSEKNALTPSQRKYLDMINAWGTWDEFQSLLVELSRIADKHGVSITNVAAKWVLQQPAVGAVLVGTRLGVSSRSADNLRAYGWELGDAEMATINAIALGNAGKKTDILFQKLGDCGNEYRAAKK